MNWLLGDYIYGAYQSLRRSRLRTLLTVLGVAIGVGSVTAIFALSGGLTDVLNRQLTRIGGNIIVVRPGGDKAVTPTAPANQQYYTTSTLSESDVEKIRAVDGVDAVAPIMVQSATLKTGTRTLDNSVVVSTTPELEKIAKLDVRDGQFLDTNSPDSVAVLGHQLAIDLFGTEKPIGLTFTVRGERYTVIGVLKASLDPVNYNRIDFDNSVFLTFNAGKTINHGRVQIQQIDIRAKDTTQLSDLTDVINTTLLQNHNNEHDFNMASGGSVSRETNDFMRSVALVLAAIAAISLVVGGVGIMNIMLVGVAERTREIGIRKSVGATSSSIALQFMIESVMMSVMGGLFGYIIGYTVAFGISTYLYFVPSVNWQVAGIALVMSLGVGVLFGFYPALRAARKHPIESLRQYH